MGQNTGQVESLTSYFCRLAHSHGMKARDLAAWTLKYFGEPIPEDYKWYRRAFAGASQESEQWSSWIAALTGVGGLDRLTLTPWRHLVSNCSLTSRVDRWCPDCLRDDKAANRSSYLRLSWDIASVTACVKHKVNLASTCPHCERPNVRHRASAVIPGYCTACGGFLGDQTTRLAEPAAIWQATQIEQMLSRPPEIDADRVPELLETLVERMAHGRIATFAEELGLSKSGVWHWFNKRGLPTLQAWLAISLRGGRGLDRLFAGDLENWVLPDNDAQLAIPLEGSPRKGIRARYLDWPHIRAQLRAILGAPETMSLAQVSKQLGIDQKQLYQNANDEVRAIVSRYQGHRAGSRDDKMQRLQDQVAELLQERWAEGYTGMSAREVWPFLDVNLKSVRHSFRHIDAAIAANDP
jgi:DNA-binding phage protein